jgi:FolB domain-containing protein
MSNEPDLFSDRIHIEQLEISARVGVPEKERAAPQRLTATITLWPQRQAEELHDHIAKTVNYSEICDETKKFVADRSDKLIETLAGHLAAHLLQMFPIQKIEIELRKFVVPDAQYVSVTVTRSAALD